jgi:hypothetical protein
MMKELGVFVHKIVSLRKLSGREKLLSSKARFPEKNGT